jgi:hypothetical protein
VDKRFYTERLDFLFGMDSEFFADFDFDGQSVGIPASFALAKESLHRFVSGIEVFDGSGEAMTGMGQPIGGGGTFVEDESGIISSALERLFVNVVFPPESEDFEFLIGKREGIVRFSRNSHCAQGLYGRQTCEILPHNAENAKGQINTYQFIISS